MAPEYLVIVHLPNARGIADRIPSSFEFQRRGDFLYRWKHDGYHTFRTLTEVSLIITPFTVFNHYGNTSNI